MDSADQLLIFAKFPKIGTVKTRLGKAIGQESAAALYRCFVEDTLAMSRRAGYRPVVFFEPRYARDDMTEWLGVELSYEPQQGDDLGQRMYAAFQKAFTGCERAVLIGTDIPDLRPAVVREAFEGLNSHDAVIGPACDGGYYLIGFSSRSLLPAAFGALPWGTANVFEITLRILKENGLHVHRLPEWPDVDDYDDLKALFDQHRDLPRGRLATIDYLKDHLRW